MAKKSDEKYNFNLQEVVRNIIKDEGFIKKDQLISSDEIDDLMSPIVSKIVKTHMVELAKLIIEKFDTNEEKK